MTVALAEPIKLYTRTVCPKCIYIKSELSRAGIDYEIINIDEDSEAKALIKDAGFMAAPILEHHGELIADIGQILSIIQEA